jgi:hypothetical protein
MKQAELVKNHVAGTNNPLPITNAGSITGPYHAHCPICNSLFSQVDIRVFKNKLHVCSTTV